MIERATSYRRIKRVAPNWTLVVSDELYYLIEVRDGRDVGVWAFEPCENGFRVHANMSKEYRGAKAAVSARSAFEWMFENTKCGIIFAGIPEFMHHVQMMACHIGMTFDGKTQDFREYSMIRQELNIGRAA